eukprot:11581671-Alexandrium_andersonii.AAC.1
MYGASTDGPEDEEVTAPASGREWYIPSAEVAAGLARTQPTPGPAEGQPAPRAPTRGHAEPRPAPASPGPAAAHQQPQPQHQAGGYGVQAEWGANADITAAAAAQRWGPLFVSDM